MEAEARRKILEALASDEQTSTTDRLRALDLLDRLDARPESNPEFAVWQEFAAMAPEQLDAELEALEAPLKTGLAYEGDEYDAAVERAAAVRANEIVAELRRETHQLRKALAAAEARLAPAPSEPLPQVADLNERREARSEAPSLSQQAPEKIVVPDGVEVGVGWKIPGASRRTSGLS